MKTQSDYVTKIQFSEFGELWSPWHSLLWSGKVSESYQSCFWLHLTTLWVMSSASVPLKAQNWLDGHQSPHASWHVKDYPTISTSYSGQIKTLLSLNFTFEPNVSNQTPWPSTQFPASWGQEVTMATAGVAKVTSQSQLWRLWNQNLPDFINLNPILNSFLLKIPRVVSDPVSCTELWLNTGWKILFRKADPNTKR